MKRDYQMFNVPIACADGEPLEIAVIEGKLVDLGYNGLEFFIHRPYRPDLSSDWHISEKSSGHTIRINGYKTQKGCIFITKDSINKAGGIPKLKKLIKKALKRNEELFGYSVMNRGCDE